MNWFRKIFFFMALTPDQRATLFNAVVYSRDKYRQRGDFERFARVNSVVEAVFPKTENEQLYIERDVRTRLDNLRRSISELEREVEKRKSEQEYERGYKDAVVHTRDYLIRDISENFDDYAEELGFQRTCVTITELKDKVDEEKSEKDAEAEKEAGVEVEEGDTASPDTESVESEKSDTEQK